MEYLLVYYDYEDCIKSQDSVMDIIMRHTSKKYCWWTGTQHYSYDKQLYLLVLIFLSLWTGTAYSQCEIVNNEQGKIVECDISFSLRPSNPSTWEGEHRDTVNKELEQLAHVWCNSSLANSRIRRISMYTDGRPGDIIYYNYRGPSRAFLGQFTYQNGSIFVYREPLSSDQTNAQVTAHELSHGLWSLYDEYSGARLALCIGTTRDYGTLTTLMGVILQDVFRFSHPNDYPRERGIITVQSDCYGKSAWEVLTQSTYHDDVRAARLRAQYPRQDYLFQAGVGLPDFDQLSASYTCTPPIIDWVSSANVVVMMMDDSASMGDNQRLALAKQATKDVVEVLYAEAPPIELGIISFDDTARTEVVPMRLDAIENLRMIQSVIDSLVADGGTDYETALEEAQTLFANSASNGHQTLVIISDGETEQSDYGYFKDNGISVYTVELDTEGQVVLQDALLKTRNRFKMEVDAQRLPSFLPSVFRNESLVRNAQLVKSVSLHNRVFEDVATTNTVISEMTESASFILRWDGDAYFDGFTLRDPAGVTIDQAYADSLATDGVTDEVRYLQSDKQAIYYIGSPAPGIWEVRITGTGNFAYEAAVHSDVVVGINAGAEIIVQEVPSEVVTYPEPIPILVNVSSELPITRADVRAEITMPDDSTMSVVLTDDGNAPDKTAADGLYSAMLADYSQDGICEIKVTVSNLDGDALLDNTSVLYHPMSAPDGSPILNVPTVPQQAPIFQRVVYDQVDVVNTEEKMMPPPLSVEPTTITSIPYLDKGSIERAGQVNWYVFNAMSEGETYYLQTSNLMGYDNTQMVTELNLYEPDGTSLIERSVRHRGSDVSSIEWTAPRAGDYLVSVAHAERDRGYYEFTVRDKNILSEGEMREAGRRSSSGGFVGYPLLLLLLLAFFCNGNKRLNMVQNSVRHQIYDNHT